MAEISKQCEKRLWEIYRYGRKLKLHQFGSFFTFYKFHSNNYRQKMSASKRQGKDFTLTLQDWFELWDVDLLHNQNSRYKKRMICRIIEPGPYSRENVYIGDAQTNADDCKRNGNLKTRKRKCWFDGVEYESTTEAIKASGLSAHKFYKHPSYKAGEIYFSTQNT